MKVLKTRVSSDNGTVYSVDTIAHEGELWLVPYWLEAVGQRWKKPSRMILLSTLPHRVLQTRPGRDDIILDAPMSRAILESAIPASTVEITIVLDNPDVLVSTRHQ